MTDASQPRVLGPWAAFSIVAGSMLGVGIFLFPGRMALLIQEPSTFLGLWLVGGLIAVAGATACGELGVMMPQAGGDYVFHYEAFGPSVAFASGWVLFAAVFPGSIASMAAAVFHFQLGSLLGVDLRAPWLWGVSGGQWGALALVFGLTWLNTRSARESGRFQTLFTLLPMLLLLLLGLAFFASGKGVAAPFATPPQAKASGLSQWIAGLLMVYFAYSGWLNIIYVAGEVQNPRRDIPRSMLWATSCVTALYLLLCLAFLGALGMAGLAKAGASWTDAGTASARALSMPWLGTLVLLLIAAVIFTSINATILAGARVAYAMAHQGAFSGVAKPLNRHGTPARALWLQAAIAALFLLSGTFDEIVAATSIAMLATGAFTVASLFVLRSTQPHRQRTYRAWGYPWFPALYLLFSLVAIGVKVTEALQKHTFKGWLPLIGILVFLAAWASHRFFFRPP